MTIIPPHQTIETTILATHAALLTLTPLVPGPKVDALLTQLITLLISPELEHPRIAAPLLASPHITAITPSLRDLCSSAEYHLESHWAHRIAASSDPWETLAEFPYIDNYHALTRLETHSLLGVGAAPNLPWTILGSGPLPLSAITLALQNPRVEVDCVERCPAAVKISRRVIELLGLQERVKVRLGEAGEWRERREGVVMVAALILGKEEVFRRVGGWVVVRSARGVRRLVYEPVEVEVLRGCGLRVVSGVEPYECDGGVVNSVLVCKGRGERE